mgnify:CR=1 FL=1
MKIQQFSQQGKRSNNEDSLGTNECLLTVCDGMGGHNYGERASAFVKDAMLKAFAEVHPMGKMEIQQQLNMVQSDLNHLLETEPELERMGTTFTGIFRTPDVWYAAHIGDSRIYLFRPSEQKLWHTWDHSLVGELMRTHEITIEAGRFHPMSNRISKAIIAQKEGKPSSASIVKIDELKAGDVLLLCSDGVIEAWSDRELVQLFSDSNLSFEQKCKRLAKQCNDNSKDNNTAIIAMIEEEDAFSYGTNEELEWTTFDEVEDDYRQYLKDNGEEDESSGDDEEEEENETDGYADEMESGEPRRRHWGIVIGVLVVAALLLLGLWLPHKNKADKANPKANTPEKVERPRAGNQATAPKIVKQAADANASEKTDTTNVKKPGVDSVAKVDTAKKAEASNATSKEELKNW